MPHVALVPLVGFRIREEELLALGMSLPGLAPRAKAVGQLPALGLLTLAGMLPEHWTCDYRPADICNDELVAEIAAGKPSLVAISALTASIHKAYAGRETEGGYSRIATDRRTRCSMSPITRTRCRRRS